MSFREDFLEKISGFSSERLRTEQRLLEQERDSLKEEVNQLDKLLQEQKDNRNKIVSRKAEMDQSIQAEESKLEEEIIRLVGSKKSIRTREPFDNYEENNWIRIGNFALFFILPIAIVFYLDFDLETGIFFVIFYWIIVYFTRFVIRDSKKTKSEQFNLDLEKKIKEAKTTDPALKKIDKSIERLRKAKGGITEEEWEFTKTNIEPLQEERSILVSRMSEISALLKDVLPNLLKTTRKKERHARFKAMLGEARDASQSTKKFLLSETDENWICPYHNEKADRETAEADHIHPVSKGGQSTLQNMVLVCYDCNRGKGDSTLRNFCKVKGFIFEEVCERLESDGKEI